MFSFSILLISCTAPQAPPDQIEVEIQVDDQQIQIAAPAGTTVEGVLKTAGVQLNSLDRTDPSAVTVLGTGAQVRVVRVSEKFEVITNTVPFEHQLLRNESLPSDSQVYLQSGQNGSQEITYRRVFEDGVEISNTPIKSVVVEEPVPEIVMVGIQAPFFPVKLTGRLVYLRDGNAWSIEESTGNRKAVVTTSDLDGRIFSLSDDGAWLLFTRKVDNSEQINSLWVVNLNNPETSLVDLQVPNVVHFADWVPSSTTKIVFSTVEPRSTAPGWQANNDLNALTFSETGWTTKWSVIIEPNSGGVYGWWGADFTWDPQGERLAFIHPDGVGLVNYKDGLQTSLIQVLPYQTRGDWAWVPGTAWSPDGTSLYGVIHSASPGSASPEESQLFDLSAVPLQAGAAVTLVSQTGMFAYPLASPQQTLTSGENEFRIAYLQATFPTQSETSRYRVAIIDRDGSDRRLVFPPEGMSGLTPQKNWGVWSPAPLPESDEFALAVIYTGNLWLVDSHSGEAKQVTGDGLTTRLAWK